MQPIDVAHAALMVKDAVDLLNDEVARLQRRESQLEAQVETLEIVISRLRSICDAAFTLVREDDDELVDWRWCVLLCTLEDANYEPRP